MRRPGEPAERAQAIASDDDPLVSDKIRQQLADGVSDLDASYTGPRLEETRVDGKVSAKPTREFVEGLIEHFRAGKVRAPSRHRLPYRDLSRMATSARRRSSCAQLIPRRYVWLIALGCHEVLLSHQSLVDVEIKQGESIDVCVKVQLESR